MLIIFGLIQKNIFSIEMKKNLYVTYMTYMVSLEKQYKIKYYANN